MKIALLGSAPSSLGLAPFEDASWTIWGCSPGAFPIVRRADAWFELHRWEPHQPWFPAEYVDWLSKLPCPVWTNELVPEIPKSVVYPKEAMRAEFGRYWFTSSLSWMFALAIVQPGIEEIGVWGVDMSAAEEYGFQRAGCHRFREFALERGIKVTAPPESDLFAPPPLYGIGETDPKRIKFMARKAELDSKLSAAAQAVEQRKADFEAAVREHLYFQGASEDMQYHLNTWTD